MKYYKELQGPDVNEYTAREIKNTIKKAQELQDQGLDCEIIHEYCEYDGAEHYERTSIKFKHRGYSLRVSTFHDGYSPARLEYIQHEHIDRDTVNSSYKKHFDGLNKVKTFNLKRFTVLIEAYCNHLDELKALNEQNRAIYNEKLNKIEAFTGKRSDSGYFDFDIYSYEWELSRHGYLSDSINIKRYVENQKPLDIAIRLKASA